MVRGVHGAPSDKWIDILLGVDLTGGPVATSSRHRVAAVVGRALVGMARILVATTGIMLVVAILVGLRLGSARANAERLRECIAQLREAGFPTAIDGLSRAPNEDLCRKLSWAGHALRSEREHSLVYVLPESPATWTQDMWDEVGSWLPLREVAIAPVMEAVAAGEECAPPVDWGARFEEKFDFPPTLDDQLEVWLVLRTQAVMAAKHGESGEFGECMVRGLALVRVPKYPTVMELLRAQSIARDIMRTFIRAYAVNRAVHYLAAFDRCMPLLAAWRSQAWWGNALHAYRAVVLSRLPSVVDEETSGEAIEFLRLAGAAVRCVSGENGAALMEDLERGVRETTQTFRLSCDVLMQVCRAHRGFNAQLAVLDAGMEALAVRRRTGVWPIGCSIVDPPSGLPVQVIAGDGGIVIRSPTTGEDVLDWRLE